VGDKWQFSLRYLVVLTTAIALTIALPLSCVSNPGVVVTAHLLLWLSATGAALGGWFGRMLEGTLAGTFVWLVILFIILLLFSR
jgi:hypothetical protein